VYHFTALQDGISTVNDRLAPVQGRSLSIQPRPLRRRYLFLQGPASPFFAQLSRKLQSSSHKVYRINFCFGDQIFWPDAATNYRGNLAKWPSFLREFLTKHSITDIILFGDCRPYHRVAVDLAAGRGVTVHVFEDGYLRPNWITVERNGVNGYSSLPRDPDVIRQSGAIQDIPKPLALAGGMTHRVFWDILYNVATVFGRPLFPGYQRHRTHHPFWEYAGWIRRLSRFRAAKRHTEAQVRRLLSDAGGFYLVPLQLDDDFQIRKHSRFGGNEKFLRETIESFARCAPPQSHLLIKIHPLDNGLIDRQRQVGKIAAACGVQPRVTCIDGGLLPTLLEAARGVVLVNSTTGTSAIYHRRPTIALGTAIYAIPGLTFQGRLDDFWCNATAPDAELFTAFYKLTVSETQIAGNLYTPEGIAYGVEAAALRVVQAPAPAVAVEALQAPMGARIWPFLPSASELIGPRSTNDNARPSGGNANWPGLPVAEQWHASRSN
jgi:capsular polysaccharide export protein